MITFSIELVGTILARLYSDDFVFANEAHIDILTLVILMVFLRYKERINAVFTTLYIIYLSLNGCD